MTNPESQTSYATGSLVETHPGSSRYSQRYRWYALVLMTLAFTFYTADRVLLGVLVQPIQNEFGASDSQMGFVSLLVSASYALFVIPFGLLADRINRRNLLAAILTGWSAMTVLTGFSRNIVHLALAQMVVAVNEAGAAPTMNSLISDLFARAKRGLPIAIWYCGIAAGTFVGYSVGGFLGEAYGWRTTFIALGLPGVLIGLLVLLTLRETPRGMADGLANKVEKAPDFKNTVAFLIRQKALRHAVLAQCLSGIAFMGPIYWLAAFFFRTHDAGLAQTGMVIGIIFLTTGLLSAPIGGFIMDRLGVRDPRWHGWLGAMFMIGGAVAMAGVYLLPVAVAAFAAVAVWQLVTGPVTPINITIVSNLAPAQYRGLSISIGFLLFHLMGFGLGSQAIGVLSDWFAGSWGFGPQDALRLACLSMVLFHLWAAFHFWMVSRHAKTGYATATELEQGWVKRGA